MAELDDKVIVTKQKLTNIADQIRAELSETDEYKLDVMPTKIHEVAQGGGGSAVINPLSITQNGTYTATGNVDGYSPITVAVHSIEDGIQWMRDFDFEKSEEDNLTGLSANTTNCTYTSGTGLEWENYTSKVDAFFTFNQDYNYDIIFKFGSNGYDFGTTGSVASINCLSNTNLSINLFIQSDLMSEYSELCYAIGSGSANRTGIDIEDLADVEIKIQMRLNSSNNWDVTLVIDSMSYSQLIGTMNGKKESCFVFGRGQYDSFNNWVLKALQIKQIIGDGSTRVLEDKSITTNGTYYPSTGKYGFSRVDVNVPTSANLQTLNVTQNGTYTPTSPVDGYDEVVVNVSESAEKVVMHSDFAQSNTDLQTGVIEFSGNCAYDSTSKKLGMYYNDHRGYANFNYIINQDLNYNYKIEIELDEVTEGTRATDKYLFALYLNPNSQSGAELRLYWNNTSSCWALHHSSGRDTYSTETNIHCFDGVKTTLTFEKRSDSTIYDIYIQSPNFNNGTKMLLHDISGNWMTRYLRIGAQGSNNGFENITINDVKITRMLYQAPRLTLLSNENDDKKETIEEKTDEVKEQKKESVEKASELDA